MEQIETSQKTLTMETEKMLLKGSCPLSSLPSWVSFPDFDRVEWINQILAQLWTNVDAYSTFFVQTLIEPQLHKILDLMQLDNLSGLRIKRVDLGSTPARVEGIKVYDKKFVGAKIE